jgi:RES domain-containing protein
MTPLHAALGGGAELIVWRLDRAKYGTAWACGEGARVAGGRWNSPGSAVVYCSLDPATTILEKAVHVGFSMLDRVPHVLTSVRIEAPESVHVIQPAALPDAEWLDTASPNAAQRIYGDALLAAHAFVVLPSVVSRRSWNVVFNPVRAAGRFALQRQERFVLDARLSRTLPL